MVIRINTPTLDLQFGQQIQIEIKLIREYLEGDRSNRGRTRYAWKIVPLRQARLVRVIGKRVLKNGYIDEGCFIPTSHHNAYLVVGNLKEKPFLIPNGSFPEFPVMIPVSTPLPQLATLDEDFGDLPF